MTYFELTANVISVIRTACAELPDHLWEEFKDEIKKELDKRPSDGA